jgi:hypothetical protein
LSKPGFRPGSRFARWTSDTRPATIAVARHAADATPDVRVGRAVERSSHIRGKTMKKIVIAMALAALASGPAHASDKTDVIATLHHAADEFNKGDMNGWVAGCTDEASIIDNFSPYEWHGAGACAKWAADLGEFMKNTGMTSGAVTFGKAKHVDVTGDRAYVVVPVAFKVTVKGKPTSYPGLMTVAMQKTAAGWRFTGWAWADQ